MDRDDNLTAGICKFCGDSFTLPEDGADGNLPRLLLCGHIYCTSCLLSLEYDRAITCPDCEVESTLPEAGVFSLQEDSRIIGLIYTWKMNKMKRCERSRNRKPYKQSPSADASPAAPEEAEQPADVEKTEKVVDEGLALAAENLAVLDKIRETLTDGLAEQMRREKARLDTEIHQAAEKAAHAVQKWRDVQLSKLSDLEAHFSSSHAAVRCVQRRMKDLEFAMKMAREVRRVPFLEQYCTLDKVVRTLQAPVDERSIDMTCITMGSGLSCGFTSESLNQDLVLTLKVEVGSPKHLPESLPRGHQLSSTNRKSPLQTVRARGRKQDQDASPSRGSPPLRRRSSRPLTSEPGSPDVILEEVIIERREDAPPPTGPELANDRGRLSRRRRCQSFGTKRHVTQWVVLSHVVNPSHFYIRYVAERRGYEILSRKINRFCSKESSRFSSADTVETGSVVLVKWKEHLWCRATVVEARQKGRVEAVDACPVAQLSALQVFFLDSGICKTFTLLTEEEDEEASLKAVSSRLRKVSEELKGELGHFAPQAIRCSLKDLVPYDLAKGWSKEAQLELISVVGSAAVEMRPLGQDRDALLVDLRKAAMAQSSDVPISVREYLVFIEVARFYSPVKLGRRPLQYYPPKSPQVNAELNAVVSHINSPADFYVQLVDNMEFVLLSAKLQDCYNAAAAGEDDLNIYCPVIEQACVARYEDKQWYRAQVTGFPGSRKVEVRYVDFGNKSVVSVGDLRKIKDEFFALPARAIRCCLADVTPVGGDAWSDASIQRFSSLAHHKLVTIVAQGRGSRAEPVPVRVFESSLDGPLGDMAELLVQEQLACFKEERTHSAGEELAVWDPPLQLASAAEAGNGPDQKEPGEQQDMRSMELDPDLKLPENLNDLKVRVSHVDSPSSFYVQLAQYDGHLKRICELLKKQAALPQPDDVLWKADMFCAAHNNGVWERGQICCDVTSSGIAEVKRCDHGNKVKLHVSNLRPLPASLEGALALECTLTDIRPAGGRSTWTATACDMISLYLTGASAVVNIKELTDERPIPVTLFCSNKMGQFVSIAEFLASEGLALRERRPRDAVTQRPTEADAQSAVTETQTVSGVKTAPPAASAPKAAPRTVLSAEKVKTQLYLPPELPCLGHIQVSVSAVGDDGLVYTRTQNAECQLEQLRERIQHSMTSLPRQKPYTWKSVQGCAVIGPDMLWYRGQLLEVQGGHVKVQYVDCGLVENIPVVHVYPMLLCEDVPQLCMSCQLHGLSPVGGKWQRDAVALLREVLLNRSVDMHVMELPSDRSGPLTVDIFLDGLSLSSILCHFDHASMDQAVCTQGHSATSPAVLLDDWDIDTKDLRGPQEPLQGPFIYPDLPQEGERFQVRVKHLWTPNRLFLWPLEGSADAQVDGETLDEALTRVNEDIGSLQPLTNFRRGGPCLAEYRDGKFYRSKLIRFVSVEPVRILVQHVDFGSDDTLPTSKLRQMPSELLRFPSRALKVKVGGFKAPSASGQEDVLPYSPGWSVRAAIDMIDMLHGDITAAVVSRKPEFTVLLYNENQELVHLPLVSSGLAELE